MVREKRQALVEIADRLEKRTAPQRAAPAYRYAVQFQQGFHPLRAVAVVRLQEIAFPLRALAHLARARQPPADGYLAMLVQEFDLDFQFLIVEDFIGGKRLDILPGGMLEGPVDAMRQSAGFLKPLVTEQGVGELRHGGMR